MKLKFIIEKGYKSAINTPVNLIDISKKEYPVTLYHNYKKIISYGVVTKEKGFLWCEAEIPQILHDLTGSIGFVKKDKKFILLEIGLIEQKDNIDQTIKPIGHPQP